MREIESMTDLARRDTALRLNPDVIAKRLDQATVLVHMSTNRIFELNETGARVWELLGQGLDADRIVRHLVDEFDVDDARAADEVKNLLMRLRTEGLLTS
jgi:Coenzyme PQQ synthesis protein D (PqqD)